MESWALTPQVAIAAGIAVALLLVVLVVLVVRRRRTTAPHDQHHEDDEQQRDGDAGRDRDLRRERPRLHTPVGLTARRQLFNFTDTILLTPGSSIVTP